MVVLAIGLAGCDLSSVPEQVIVLHVVVETMAENGLYPEGEHHVANAFIRTGDRQKAGDIAAHRLEEMALRLVQIERSGVASPERIARIGRVMRQAYQDALRSGFGVVVFDEPVEAPQQNPPDGGAAPSDP